MKHHDSPRDPGLSRANVPSKRVEVLAPAPLARLEGQLQAAGLAPSIPAILVRAGAERSYADFFLARYSNAHTKRAYKRIVDRFLDWCGREGLELAEVAPATCGRYRDALQGSAAKKKQTLAALRKFFDLLVERHFCLINPARSTENPKEVVEEGNTPEMPPGEVERLLASIDTSHVVGLRDRAILAVMAATGCRVGAVAKLRLRHLYYEDGQWFLRLDEKNSKKRSVPVRHDLQRFILQYLEGAGLTGADEEEAVFRSAIGRTKQLRPYVPAVEGPDGLVVDRARGAMNADDIGKMLKRRLKEAGFADDRGRCRYSPHSFRVMVATDLLDQGADIHDVAYLLGHSSTRTTQLYDRNAKKVSRNLVERIRVKLDDAPEVEE